MAILTAISAWAVPFLLFTIPLYAWYKGVPIYEEFVAGVKEGLRITWNLLPALIAMLAVTRVFMEGGALNLIFSLLLPAGSSIGFPQEVLPLAVMRPLSGTGALAFTADLIENFGPDSFTGRLASIMQGSTETTIYVLTVYFGSVGIRKYRYALAVGLCGDIVAFIAAFYVTVFFFC